MTTPAVPRRSNRMSVVLLKTSSEQPRARVRNRPMLVERQHSFDVAYERPDEPPEEQRRHDRLDGAQRQDHPDRKTKQSDPEGADLEPVMRGQHRLSAGDMDVRQNNADQRGNAGEIADEIQNVDDERDGRAWNNGLGRRTGSSRRHSGLSLTSPRPS